MNHPPVIEYFDSLQGEGLFIGRPSVFVRTVGCNLRCPACDTAYAQHDGGIGPFISWSQMSSAVVGAPHIVLTGGEPLLWPDFLRYLDSFRPTTLVVETNGTVAVPQDMLDNKRIWWSVSPKGPWFNSAYPWGPRKSALARNVGSTGVPENLQAFSQTGRAYWKWVVLHREHMVWALQKCQALGLEGPVIFQPNNVELETPRDYLARMKYLLAEYKRIASYWPRREVRILPQLHYLMWGRKRGV